MDAHIIGMGGAHNIDAIKEPHLPFRFDTPEGATVIAAALKDGSVSEIGHHFEYANKDRKNIERVKSAIEKVFGHVEPYEWRNNDYDLIVIIYGSRPIEEALKKAGIPLGNKTEQDFHVPDFIRESSEEVQKAYLYQTLMDEGSWRVRGGKIKEIEYAQAVCIDDELTDEDADFLKRLEFKEHKLQSITVNYLIITDKLKDEIKEEDPPLWEIIEDSKPPNLEEEAEMFKKLFDADPDIKPFQLYYAEKGYKVGWKLTIDEAESAQRIAEELGLPIHRHEKGGEGCK